jgi:hypothetical protein
MLVNAWIRVSEKERRRRYSYLVVVVAFVPLKNACKWGPMRSAMCRWIAQENDWAFCAYAFSVTFTRVCHLCEYVARYTNGQACIFCVACM